VFGQPGPHHPCILPTFLRGSFSNLADTGSVRRPLLPPAWRPIAVLVWVAAAAVLALLSWHFAHAPASNRPDAVLGSQVRLRLAQQTRLLSAAARLGSPEAVIAGTLMMAVAGGLVRRPRGALFALIAAPAAGAMADIVLKPLVHRESPANVLLFPSGHTTGAFALALTAVVLLLPGRDVRLLPAVLRLALAGLALGIAGIVGIAVVALGWHYATDAVGGVVTAVVVVLAVAAVVDAVSDRWLAGRTR
jgi:membrane-associated phospholipid phosphatase